MKTGFRLALRVMLCLAFASGPANMRPAAAETWPDRPVTMLVGFPPGGSADVVARAMAPYLSESLGVPIVVVNKPGANSQVAVNELLSSRDDGYTIFFSSLSPFIAATIIEQKAPYKLDDIAFVNAQWTDWDLLFARKDTPYRALADVIAEIKAHPGKIGIGVVLGSPSHLSCLLLLEAAGIRSEDVNIVPYRGGNDVRLAVLGGQVDIAFAPAQETTGVKGEIRPLAVFRENRAPDWDGPTIGEALGPLGVTVPLVKGTMRGMAVSAGLVRQFPDRYAKLVDTYRAVLARPDVQDQLRKLGLGGDWLGPEKTTAEIRENYAMLLKYQTLLNPK